MIYSASYFESQRHHGQLISISRSIPKGFRVNGTLNFFVPSADLLKDWKEKLIDEEAYTARYREQIKANFKIIKGWLSELKPEKDATLLCWERSGAEETIKTLEETGRWQKTQPFCHRNLVIKLVQKYRPDCYGGTDVNNLSLPICAKCRTEIIPAFITEGFDDRHYCTKCQTWTLDVVYRDKT
ncbi:MAG: hypothetical protein N5P05_004286 (plasmid) [Chroococcopsis gigantea SAG 12.99]|jgi:hypothetical protein|nr:hypothetical protein [Chroococcopsis gigantea SAG 12.99]